MTGEYSERLLEADALERIIFSLDGVTAETYEAIRKGGNFAQVIGNIDGFLRAKAEAGLTRPRATIQILVMNRTEEQLDRFLEAWVPKLGPTDDILIKEVDTFGGQVEDMRVEDRTPEKRFACRQLFKDMSISWDGMVTVCCKDVLYLLTVGDAIEQDLEEIWRSREWERIRRLHREGRWNELQPCDNCSEWYL